MANTTDGIASTVELSKDADNTLSWDPYGRLYGAAGSTPPPAGTPKSIAVAGGSSATTDCTGATAIAINANLGAGTNTTVTLSNVGPGVPISVYAANTGADTKPLLLRVWKGTTAGTAYATPVVMDTGDVVTTFNAGVPAAKSMLAHGLTYDDGTTTQCPFMARNYAPPPA